MSTPTRVSTATTHTPSAATIVPLLIPLCIVGGIFLSTLTLSDAPMNDIWTPVTTVFVSIILEAMPFLLLGVIVSSLLHAFVSPERIRLLTERVPTFGLVTLASLGGLILPLCECGMIPIIRTLIQKKLPIPVALVYMLAAPIINPIVISSTVVAFPQAAEMVWGRVAVALIVVLFAGWLYLLLERLFTHRLPANTLTHSMLQTYTNDASPVHTHTHTHSDRPTRLSRLRHSIEHMGQEWTDTALFLALGAFITALFQTHVPRNWFLDAAWMNGPAEHFGFMGLAYVLSLCSTSDAFIASSFYSTAAPPALLSFLVFGPMLDLKMTFMMMTVFRKRFIIVFTLLLAGVIPFVSHFVYKWLSH
ncbi:permease [Paenibacillus sp. 481]|uniref:permease n=1 Tax=Paenibacillus sp. 481 TaxID=2835869 RepID=UPI001E37AFC0|nr:permease [Paenibacillus sp. 481]UHA73052.1 permease [Paenibacillus sp. 481]